METGRLLSIWAGVAEAWGRADDHTVLREGRAAETSRTVLEVPFQNSASENRLGTLLHLINTIH